MPELYFSAVAGKSLQRSATPDTDKVFVITDELQGLANHYIVTTVNVIIMVHHDSYKSL